VKLADAIIYIYIYVCDTITYDRQELNDKKRLATSGANFARAYTVEFGSCKFPYNFTGCQDLAKQKVRPILIALKMASSSLTSHLSSPDIIN
jgi:hypothetical protein